MCYGLLELIYCGNVLEDEKTIVASGVQPGSTLHALMKKPKGPVIFIVLITVLIIIYDVRCEYPIFLYDWILKN